MLTRLEAWLLTGPLGHGWAGLADVIAALWAARTPRSRSRPRRRRWPGRSHDAGG